MLKILRANRTGLIILAGIIIGLAIALNGLAGPFAWWESIGKPPDNPAKILAGRVDSYPGGLFYQGRKTDLFVQTDSGRIYLYRDDENPSWTETQKDKVKELNFYDCLGSSAPSARHLDDEIDNYAVYYCGEWDFGATHYAIRRDGTVWRLRLYGRFPDWPLQLCCYPVIGLVLGVGVVSIIEKRDQKHRALPT